MSKIWDEAATTVGIVYIEMCADHRRDGVVDEVEAELERETRFALALLDNWGDRERLVCRLNGGGAFDRELEGKWKQSDQELAGLRKRRQEKASNGWNPLEALDAA